MTKGFIAHEGRTIHYGPDREVKTLGEAHALLHGTDPPLSDVLSEGMREALSIIGRGDEGPTSLKGRLAQRRRERSRAATKVERRVAMGLPPYLRGSEERAQYRTKNMTAREAYDLGIATKNDLAKRWQQQAQQVTGPRYDDRSD